MRFANGFDTSFIPFHSQTFFQYYVWYITAAAEYKTKTLFFTSESQWGEQGYFCHSDPAVCNFGGPSHICQMVQ